MWGDQWLCGCGWANHSLRRKCRSCGLPRELRVEDQPVGQVLDNLRLAQSTTLGDAP